MSIFGVNVDPEKPFESLPNEVLRIVLGQLPFLKRKSTDRVSKIWRFLNHSFSSGETADLSVSDVGGALFEAAQKGDRETIFKLMDLMKEVKGERTEKEGWIWIALRVAAKNGNFDCMPPLWAAFDEISSIKNFDFSSPSIFEISEEEQDVDLQEIEQAIDNMVSEDDIEKLKLIFNDPQRALRWRITYAFRALKVFIANNQVNCMDLLLSEIKEQRGRFFLLPESCVMFMAERDRPECFKRVFDKYRHFLSLATKPVAGGGFFFLYKPKRQKLYCGLE